MALFSVRTFGFPEIHRDDQPCQLALRKGLALLIYLGEAKGPVERDVVATMLWPESSETVVRARLRRGRALRKAIELVGEFPKVVDLPASRQWHQRINTETRHVASTTARSTLSGRKELMQRWADFHVQKGSGQAPACGPGSAQPGSHEGNKGEWR